MKIVKKMIQGILCLNLIACSSSVSIKLVTDDIGNSVNEIHYEYTGEEVKVELIDLITNLDELDLNKVAENIIIQADTIAFKEKEETTESTMMKVVVEEDKAYIKLKELGTYQVTYKDKKIEKGITLIVEDTTAPTFDNESDVIEIPFASNKEEIRKQILVKDLFDIEVDIDDKDLDYNNGGEYKIKVTATDINKNKATKEFTVKVKDEEKQKDESKNISETSNTAGNGNGWGTTTPAVTSPVVPPTDNGSGEGTTPPVTPEPPHILFGWVGNTGMIFNTVEEARTWAEANLGDHTTYVLIEIVYNDNSRKWSVEFDCN